MSIKLEVRDPSEDLVEQIFPPGQVHLIGGSPGSGKTAFVIWMASLIMRGEPFLSRPTNPPQSWHTLIIDRDSDAHRLFWLAAGETSMPPYYCLTEDPEMKPEMMAVNHDDAKSYGLLLRALDKLNIQAGGVLIVDVVNFFSGDYRQGWGNGFIAGWQLNKLARDRGITILGIMHGGKQKKFDSYLRLIDRMIANSGFLGAVGTKAYLASEEESGIGEGIQLFSWQSHYWPTETFRLRRTPSGLYEMVEKVSVAVGQEAQEGRGEEERPERWDLYLAWFPPEGARNYLPTFTFLSNAEKLGISKRTAERDIERMQKAGLIVKWQGKRSAWQAKQRPQVEEVQ